MVANTVCRNVLGYLLIGVTVTMVVVAFTPLIIDVITEVRQFNVHFGQRITGVRVDGTVELPFFGGFVKTPAWQIRTEDGRLWRITAGNKQPAVGMIARECFASGDKREEIKTSNTPPSFFPIADEYERNYNRMSLVDNVKTLYWKIPLEKVSSWRR